MSDDDSSTLIVLLETSKLFWKAVSANAQANDLSAAPENLIEQLLTFLRAFLLVSESNKIALVAVHNASSPLLFISPGLQQDPGAIIQSPDLPSSIIKARLGSLARQHDQKDEGPALAGALSRVLCLLHRVQLRHPSTREAQRKARVLCIQATPDISAQYIAFMNAIFSAQRHDVVIDACMVGTMHSSLLQQACHLTGGIYTKPARPGGLLQYLLTVYAGESHTRSLLMLPQTHGVDFRASCFCHKRAIDLGYVCSVCLSIFCESLQECSTCGTMFPASNSGSKRKGDLLSAPSYKASHS